jgi:hypothetical protein
MARWGHAGRGRRRERDQPAGSSSRRLERASRRLLLGPMRASTSAGLLSCVRGGLPTHQTQTPPIHPPIHSTPHPFATNNAAATSSRSRWRSRGSPWPPPSRSPRPPPAAAGWPPSPPPPAGLCPPHARPRRCTPSPPPPLARSTRRPPARRRLPQVRLPPPPPAPDSSDFGSGLELRVARAVDL